MMVKGSKIGGISRMQKNKNSVKESRLEKLLADMKMRLLDDSVPVSSILRMALVLSYENEDLKL